MASSVTGTEEILKNLEAKLGQARANRIVNKALRESAKEIYDDVKSAAASYMDTGATHDEVVMSGIKGAKKGVKTIEVGFNGPKKRYALVHLNEFGYTRYGKFQRPRGMGKLQAVVTKTESSIVPKMQAELEELAK